MRKNIQKGIEKDKNIDVLTNAFEIFNQRTEKLTRAYEELEERVARVNKELASTNEKLNQKVIELDTATSYLNSILESMTNGVIAVDLEGKITTFNKFAQTITGLKKEEVLGQKFDYVLRDNEGLIASFKKVFKEGVSVFNQETEIINSKGERISVESSVSLINDKEGKVKGALEVFRDLSEIKDLQEQLKRTERLKVLGEMAATVAHEIRNPLGGIEGFASLLERDLEKQEGKRRLVSNIIEGTRSLNHFVTSLLDFTKPVKVDISDLKVCEIIDNTLLFLGCEEKDGVIYYETENRHIKIVRKYADDVEEIRGDQGQLRQAFMNIIINAFQAIKGQGKIDISVDVKNIKIKNTSVVAMAFKDTGCGIAEDVLSKLFNPFFTTKEKGIGLGLATVHKIIDAHKGTISVKSRLNKGTTFTIYIPTI